MATNTGIQSYQDYMKTRNPAGGPTPPGGGYQYDSTFNPSAGTVKPITLPYTDPNQNSQFVAPTSDSGILPAAQAAALAGPQTGTMGMTTAATQNLLRDPGQFLPQNQPGYINQKVGDYNVSRGQALEGLRQKTGDVAGSGENLRGLVDVALEGARGEQGLKYELENEAAQMQRDAYFDAIAEGRTTAQTETDIWGTGLSMLLGTHAAEEDTLGRETNTALSLEMQTRDMNHDEKMAYVTTTLAEAVADNDVVRQKEILSYGHAIELDRIGAEYGYEGAQSYIDHQYDLALQNGDAVNQQTLLGLEMRYKASENLKDRALEEARIALTERGIDLAVIESEYARITSEIDAGRVHPDAAYDYLVATVGSYGIDLPAVDSEQAVKDAIKANFDNMLYDYSLSARPEELDALGNLNSVGTDNFKAQFRNVMYQQGNVVEEVIAGITNAATYIGGASPTSKNHAAYQELYDVAVDPKLMHNTVGQGPRSDPVRVRFSGAVPSLNTPFFHNGKLYVATSGVSLEDTSARVGETEYFYAINVDTGQSLRITAKSTPRTWQTR